jgi:hypothetical protein
MARSDWNIFCIDTIPSYFGYQSSSVVATPSSNSSRFTFYNWTAYDAWGIVNKNVQQRDGYISCAIRSSDIGTSFNMAGVMIRVPTLFADKAITAAANLDCYVAGIYRDKTDTTVNCNLQRISNAGSFTILGSWTLPIVNNEFIQFEIDVANDISSNVVFQRRHNTGSALEAPGGANWTSWTTIATDTGHGGILNQTGYWGLIAIPYQNGSSSAKQSIYFDDVRLGDNP